MANEKEIGKLQKNIDDSLGKAYSGLYFNDPTVNKTLSYMRTKVHRGIDALISNNISNVGFSNVSRLFDKTNLSDMQSDKDIIQGINATMENESLMSSLMQSYTQNSWIRELDNEIDMVCKYMPKLEEALDTRREHVLSADHFSKNSINIRSKSAAGKDISANSNIKEMRERYDLDDLLDRVYREADRKGECFVYIVPYKKAIKKLLANRNGMQLTESGECELPEQHINEAFTVGMSNDDLISESVGYTGDDLFSQNANSNFTIELGKCGILETALADYTKANKVLVEASALSVNESVKKTSIEDKGSIEDTINKGKEDFYKTDGLAQDGVKIGNMNTTTDIDEIKVPGCVVKILDHTMVKPLMIDDICLGYFYIECDKKMDMDQTTFSSTIGGIRPGGGYKNHAQTLGFEDTQESLLLKRLSLKISQKINAQFVNANQDLSKEIYMILKYNATVNAVGRISRMRVTFIPCEDMVHAYFDLDRETHRGISSLAKALFPAKLYSCLYISNSINILTRGNDRRVFYVKQQVDTNISGVLLNTLNQIQRSNFGLRQIESMNNVLGTLGRFNDFLIPRSPSGEAPVDFEVIPGQNIEFKTDLMSALEEMAVSSTDVPLEVLQSQNTADFATHLTMTNTKFLQKIYNRQSKTKKIFDKVITKIYDAEFDSSDAIDVQLPPPMYLNTVNTAQIFQQSSEVVGQIAEIYGSKLTNNQDAMDRFTRKLRRMYISSFVNEEAVQNLLDEALIESKQEEESNPQE